MWVEVNPHWPTIFSRAATRTSRSWIFPKLLSTFARSELGAASEQIRWLVADVTVTELGLGTYDVWHDRAVFHFLTTMEQRADYVRNVARSVKPGGHVIVSTFGPDGPTKCSGLDVVRYEEESLHREFGVRFHLKGSSKELHQTPFGTTQQFLCCYCRIEEK